VTAAPPAPARNATAEEVEAYLASIDYEFTVKLRRPVTLGETYSEIRLREPTAAEWSQWDKLNGIEADIKAVSVISGIPEAAVRQVGSSELVKASNFIQLFLF
jgi:hypothetical protein